jgi:LMBR1-like membrane protein
MGLEVPIILLTLLLIVTLLVLDHYGNRKTFPWYVQTTCFIAYFIPFSIIVILPLDLASTRYRGCIQQKLPDCDEPFGYVENNVLMAYWEVAYWIMFNLQMFIVPVMQGYVRSGHTTFLLR